MNTQQEVFEHKKVVLICQIYLQPKNIIRLDDTRLFRSIRTGDQATFIIRCRILHFT